MVKKEALDDLVRLPSVTKLKGQEQLDEIERRLSLLYDDCSGRKASMTVIHIRVVLGIDDNTYQRWLQAKVGSRQPDGTKHDINVEDSETIAGEEKKHIVMRRDVLKKWVDKAQMATVEAISANPKAGGPVFLSKAVWGYRDHETEGRLNVTMSVEDFLSGIKKPAKHDD